LKSVALMVNRHIAGEQVKPVVKRILKWLEMRGASACILDASHCAGECPVCPENVLENVELAMALGGDGTVLSTARMVAPAGVPILGVRLGQLGFLSEIEPANLETALERLERGTYFLEERRMLEATVMREGQVVYSGICLNDVVVSKGVLLRPVEIGLGIDDERVTAYYGDGLIVSTPTGSTAYSLSAGGPLLAPDVNAVVITPLCAHNLFARPIVVGLDDIIRVVLIKSQKGTMCILDGQESYLLDEGDEILIQASPDVARLVRFTRWSFFHVLREKLGTRDA
jgi:NAD+ kinase